jgi:hypothetical protein
MISRYGPPSGTMRLAVPQWGWLPPGTDANPYSVDNRLAVASMSFATSRT